MNGVSDVIIMNGYNRTDGFRAVLRTIYDERVYVDAANLLIGKYKQIEAI
ncbi:MAG: hypothetical protein C5S48_05400 [Candidatus Methanogaster sp.]|nr:MAG: hypothetical protein C5S48_05400 [ANME-2 cluster archaeon]